MTLIGKANFFKKAVNLYFKKVLKEKERENLSFGGLKTIENLSVTGKSDILKVTGEALAEGTYVGTSKKAKFYPIAVLRKYANTLIDKPIIWDHEKDESGIPKAQFVVGKVTDVWTEGKRIKYEGEIYIQNAIDLIINGAISKVSAGMLTDSSMNYEKNSEVPTVFDLEFVELSLVVKPSYQNANIEPKK